MWATIQSTRKETIMSRTFELLFGCVLISTGIASAQTVYSVPPNTKGNQLDLTVVNESPTAAAVELELKAIKYPPTVTFRAVTQTIESIPPRSERSATFTFDVGRPASVNLTDTLEFLISLPSPKRSFSSASTHRSVLQRAGAQAGDRAGAVWQKSIIINYTPPAVFALEQNYLRPLRGRESRTDKEGSIM